MQGGGSRRGKQKRRSATFLAVAATWQKYLSGSISRLGVENRTAAATVMMGTADPQPSMFSHINLRSMCPPIIRDAEDPPADRQGANPAALRAAACRDWPPVHSAGVAIPGLAGHHVGTSRSAGADGEPRLALVCGAGFRADAVGSRHVLAEPEAALYREWAARTVA